MNKSNKEIPLPIWKKDRPHKKLWLLKQTNEQRSVKRKTTARCTSAKKQLTSLREFLI
jgi:hypothetical protein